MSHTRVSINCMSTFYTFYDKYITYNCSRLCHSLSILDQLFEYLNYSNSPYFYRDSRLKEVYVLEDHSQISHEKSFVPIIYVCEADTGKEALDIHRFVWNQNCVPFLLVVTPKYFRLYPGFNFDTTTRAVKQGYAGHQ